MARAMPGPTLLGFDELLAQADQDSRKRRFDRLTSHLPSEMEAAIKHHRQQIKDYDAAMMAGEWETALKIKREAHDMAVRVNHGEPGILADRDSPGSVIATRCAAKAGTVPRWGQQGRWTVSVEGDFTVGRKKGAGRWSSVDVMVDLDGMFGLASAYSAFPGFAARVVDASKPFISATGYRSFLSGYGASKQPPATTADFVKRVIGDHIRLELKNSLVMVKP
jgi:hypothetical protein